MKNSICLLKIFFIVLLIAGCARPMVALKDVNETHNIDKPLTKEQVKESILEAAKYAQWRIQDLGSGTMLATYQIRVHTVKVRIAYTESSYSLYYKSSNEMKIYCTKKDFDEKKGKVVSGIQDCPDDMPPYAIHGAYQTWVDDLNLDIQTSLASKQ
jgi:hypothetical protein